MNYFIIWWLWDKNRRVTFFKQLCLNPDDSMFGSLFQVISGSNKGTDLELVILEGKKTNNIKLTVKNCRIQRKKLRRAILLYQQPGCLVELLEPLRKVLIWSSHLKLHYRDVELCQGIWALNGAGVLFLWYISVFIHLYCKETFRWIFIFLIIRLPISLHNVQNKVYFKYLRDILYLTMKLCFSILISCWKYHRCIVSY